MSGSAVSRLKPPHLQSGTTHKKSVVPVATAPLGAEGPNPKNRGTAGLSAEQIFRRLRDMNVPAEKARAAADANAAPAPTSAESKAIDKAARRMAVEAERRKFRAWCVGNGLPVPVAEHAFATTTHRRYWRWDWAWLDTPEGTTGGVALEIDGGGWVRGRHHRPKGFAQDQEKRRVGVELGWRIVNVTPQTVYTDATLTTLKRLLCVESPSPVSED